MTPPKFECQNCGECCGPVPVTDAEWRKIRRTIKGKPVEEIHRMRQQKHELLTCIFRDTDNKKCFVYDARPLICRLQGTQEKLPCPHNPGCNNLNNGKQLINDILKYDEILGILTVNLNWNDVLKGLGVTV
jgi:Fe-S-cluster containining protein